MPNASTKTAEAGRNGRKTVTSSRCRTDQHEQSLPSLPKVETGHFSEFTPGELLDNR
jgi:hypothetical protein